ncbi:MAG: RNase H-like domain-containing protein, partial [Actinomycetota bacterium]|nr:RNase H-like domain-containing protein [Actinomycetota bacterium]
MKNILPHQRKKLMKRPNHRLQISNIAPGNETETVCSMQLINAVSKKHNRNKPQICATETLETVDLDEDKLRAFTLALNTDNLGAIEAVFDSGASICCIDDKHARQHFNMFIRKSRSKFSVRTANGDIQLREYIYATVTVNGRRYRAKWYLLPKSPFKYICSRKLFLRMGYSITPPGQYRNEPVAENLDTTLYDNLVKHIEGPEFNKRTRKRPLMLIQELKRHDQGLRSDARYITKTSITNIPYLYVMETEEHLAFQMKIHKTLPEVEEKKDDFENEHQQKWNNTEKQPEIKQEEHIEPEPEDVVTTKVYVEICGKFENKEISISFRKLLDKHTACYAKNAADVGTIPNEIFRIKLKPGSTPIHAKPYPLPYNQADEIEKQIQELKAAGFLRESSSQWASPTIVVPKPTRNGKKEFRMCIDYRALNTQTIKDRYTIPSMRDLYRKLRGNKVFSNIDLRSGYHHIKIAEEDQHKTAFITDSGLYEWTRMTFGFCNGPAVFQRAMDRIFAGLDFVVIYLDDVIICSKNEKEHLQHLIQVFQRVQEHNLKLRLIKCKFFMRQIKYLGLIVNEAGIQCDQSYVQKLIKMRPPSGSADLARFLGMVQWLGRFIPNLSKLTGHFSSMKNKGFKWGEIEEELFEALKTAIENAKILRHPDFSKEFYVQTDASNKAIGAVLLQDFGNEVLEPIEFASRKLSQTEQNWHVSDKELVAIVFALNKWIRYLLPRHFTVFTDHKNLQELFKAGKHKKNQRLQRWIVMLQQFDFTAKYLPGKDNYIADFLSRDIETDDEEEKEPKPPTQYPERDFCYDDNYYEEPEGDVLLIQAKAISNTVLLIATPKEEQELEIDKEQVNIPEICAIRTKLRRSKRIKNQPQPKTYNVDKTFDAQLAGKIIPKQERKQISLDIRKRSKLDKSQQNRKWTKKLNDQNLEKYSRKDPEMKKLRKKIQQKKTKKNYEYMANQDGTIYIRRKKEGKSWRIYIPKKLRAALLEYYHSDVNFHHQGMTRMEMIIRPRYYWPGMKEDISQTVNKCNACTIARQRKIAYNTGKFIPIQANHTFEMICMDIVGPLPVTSSENRYLLTIIDRFTRFVMAIPLKEISAVQVATAFVNNWIYLFGAPDKLLTDNGTQFTSEIMEVIEQIMGIQ